jgi:hypothetical protein
MSDREDQEYPHRRTDEDLKRIFKEVFVEEIRQLFVICQESTASFSESHKLEHDFMKALIAKEKRKEAFYHDIQKQIIGWGIIAIVGSFGAWIWSQVSIIK